MEWNMEQIQEAVDCLMELKELELKRVSLEVEIAKLTKDIQAMENIK
tara:strand:- start:102 stop:242 length:141 start_codon:yes stop_codon:yes gene_type:complete